MKKIIDIEINPGAESRFRDAAALEQALGELDVSRMRERLEGFPEQLRRAAALEAAPAVRRPDTPPERLVFCGLGGSAITGDLVGDLHARAINRPTTVCRDYHLPPWVDRRTLVILLSYSGNTEETLSACREALALGAPLAAVTSGGRLGREMAAAGFPVVTVPGGYPPRTALGFLFGGAVRLLEDFGLLPADGGRLSALAGAADAVVACCRPETPFADNPARRLAARLRGVVPVFFSGPALASTAVRWKNQCEENGKQVAFTGVVPEMNHNGIVGWANPAAALESFATVFLRDDDEGERIARRFAVCADLLQPRCCTCRVSACHPDPAGRLFALVAAGDWASYYLALENNVDPTPVERITRLKEALAAPAAA